MTKRLRWFMAGFIYTLLWWLTAGIDFAHKHAENDPFWASEGPESRYRHCRDDAAYAIGWSLLPPAWVILPFVDDFFEDGWVNPITACKELTDRKDGQ